MEKSNRNIILIIIGALIVIGCICAAMIGLGGAGLFTLFRASSTISSAIIAPEQTVETTELFYSTPTIAILPSKTPDSTEITTVTPGETQQPVPTNTSKPPDSNLPPEIAKQMDQIQQQVIESRGLKPKGTFTRALLTTAQLRDHMEKDFQKDYSREEAQQDVTVLSTFGLIEPDFNFYDFYLDLLTEQVAGFYDNKTKEMYVIQGESFGGPQRLTYSHEYTHALQDQNYDIEKGLGYSDKACDKDSERCAAIQALLEGDASTLEMQWFSEFGTAEDLKQIQEFYSNFKSPVYDSAPDFLKEDFLFPYTQGQAFVEYLYNQDGWQSVDGAYKNLPISTEQILHPERYPNDQPESVELPDLSSSLGTDWKEIDRGVMGEWYTYLILAHGLDPKTRLDSETAKKAAEGWGGDAYVVYKNDQTGDVVMVISTDWDTKDDADQFVATFKDYASARFGNPAHVESGFMSWENAKGVVEFHNNGNNTLWIMSPDQPTIQKIKGQLGLQ